MTMHHHVSKRSPVDRENRSIERQIAALGGSIVPGNRHREEMLDRASDSVGRSNSKLRSAQVAIALSLVLLVLSPLLGVLTRVQAPVPVTAKQANSAALQHAEENQMSFDWALVDIFSRFRESKRPDGKTTP